MNIKKGKIFTKLKNYQIPDQKIKKNILDIKNQRNEKLYFSKPNSKLYLNRKKIIFDNYPPKKLEKITINQNSHANQKSYFIHNKPIPPLFKSIINSKKLNINKINSDKITSNKLPLSISLNLKNIIKERNKSRPLSSCSNGNKSSTNKIISKSLIDKNNINKKNNRPMSSNVNAKNKKLNLLNKSIKYRSDKELDRFRYTINLNNKSEIFNGENLRYEYIFNNLKQSITPSIEKLNKLKNSFMPRSNRMNFSNINKDKLKYYSIDNQSKYNSNYIRKYFFYKDGKTKSLDYIFENKNENKNDLICYKNVFYSTRKRNSETLNKIKLYNDMIRTRNKENIHNKKMNLEKGKRYSFYKYKEYMSQIEKEDLELYLKEKERKDLINIQEIFGNTSSRNNSLILKDNQNNQNNLPVNENYSNLNQDLKYINMIIKEEIIQEENDVKENKNIKKKQIISKKNSPKKKRKSPKRKKKTKKDDDSENSYIESDIIINNFDSGQTNKTNKKSNIAKNQRRNSFKNIVNENLFDPEINNNSIGKKTDPAEPPPDKKEEYITEILEKNINNTEIDISNSAAIKNKRRTKNVKIIDFGKDNYLQRREELMKRNKRNLLAQQLLLQKIREADKFQKGKRLSEFIPFFNLKYKYLEDDLQKKKEKMILNKYYKKNHIKKYNVRLKTKNSISFYNNTNNSMNSSMNDYMEQFTEFNNFFKQNIDNKDESINIFNNLDISNNDNKNSEENKDILDLINDETNNNKIFNNKDNDIENINILNSIDNINDENENNNKNENEIDLSDNKYDNIFERKIKNKKEIKKKNSYKEKVSEFMRLYLEKYRNQYEKEEVLPEESLEDLAYKFSNILRENEEIIRNSDKKEEIELFLEFKEKMNSLEKFSKREFNLYIIRNYNIILKILEECKRDKQKEFRINEYLKALNYDLNMLYHYKKEIAQHMKIINYQPFFSYFKQKQQV